MNITVVNVKHDHDPRTIYCGRANATRPASPLANPFRVSTEAQRGDAIAAFRKHLWAAMQDPASPQSQELRRILGLARKGAPVKLGCYCAPHACHCDVIQAALVWMAAQPDPQPPAAVAPAPQAAEIRSTRGEFGVLGNFAHTPIPAGDTLFVATAEHLFQMLKTADPKAQARIAAAPTPSKAKEIGRKVALREDWDALRIPAMAYVLRLKLARSPEARRALLDTGDRQIVEISKNDSFWGMVGGQGTNVLGRMLMKARRELIETGRIAAPTQLPAGLSLAV